MHSQYPLTPTSQRGAPSPYGAAPSTPQTHSRGLPLAPPTPVSPMAPHFAVGTPGAPLMSPVGLPQGSFGHGHAIAYGLMTPPASPEKGSSAPRGARTAQAFHPLLAVRSARASPVRFELGRGAIDIANLRVNANDLRAYATAVPTAGLLVTVHDLFELPVYASNGSYVTVGDVINHLVTAMAAPLSSQEFARLQPRFHFTRNTSRVSLLDRTVMFAGLGVTGVDSRNITRCQLHLEMRP